MKFNDWMTQKYVEWRGNAVGRDRSVKQFSDWIGVSNQLMSDWMRADGKIPKHKKTIDKLVDRFGPKVYEVLEIEPPEISSISYLPSEVREDLEAALSETKFELALQGISASDPEAEDIVIKIFSKHGLKWTRTTRS